MNKKLQVIVPILGFVFLTILFLGSRNPKKDILIANMDTSISPRKDFFAYANGGWLKRNPIPTSESNWGIGNLVEEDIKIKLKEINEKASSEKANKGSDSQKIGDFYRAGMDSVKLNLRGIAPLLPYLKRVDSANNINDLWLLTAQLRTMGSNSFFDLYIGQDEKNSNKMEVHISQGGLSLPNRDYYLKEDGRTKNIQIKFKEYLSKVNFRGSGDKIYDSNKYLPSVLRTFSFEKKLALHSRALQDLRDPISNYHKMSLAELKKLCPHVNWLNYLKICGFNAVDSVIIGQPEFLVAMDRLLDSLPLTSLKEYVKIQLIGDYSSVLSNDLYMDHFNFYGKTLYGLNEPKPRWKRVIEQEENSMGMLLGRLFIHTYFSEEAKLRYINIVSNVLQAFEGRIKNLSWMSDQTKAKALVKLHSVHPKVGFPDKWKDFTDLNIEGASYFDNVMSARKWSFKEEVAKYGKPVDRAEWGMTPQTYNAYYNPSNNEIVLPAAQFLVPGMRDEDLDDAVAYGYSAASTIGHEITHGFDDEGRQFDEKGNLTDWWTGEDTKKFNARAEKMINQFNAIKVLDSMHINGKACLGENIADLGGILIGLDAFKKTAQYKNNQLINGLNPTQRFFLGYSLGWLGQQRDESLSNQILTDVHAPGKFRVNAPFQNVPEFYSAFGVKPGDPMYREMKDRVNIW